jgi:hypothetical protein
VKKKLLFLGRLFLISLVVVWAAPWLDLSFRFLLILATSGELPATSAMRGLFYVSAVKLIPFFVLILATPGIGTVRRSAAVAAALAAYLVLDLIMLLVSEVAPFLKPDPSLTHIVATNVWDLACKWVLPFLLWFVAAHPVIGYIFGKNPGQVADEERRRGRRTE